MLETPKKVREIYEDIQKKLLYMIPEKWEELYLYASVIERFGDVETGELFFYYIPKGLLRKNPVNVYEIPNKFNLEETQYLRLVEILYDKIKELRRLYKKLENGNTWSNLTISIKDMKFTVEYSYEDLFNSEFDSYQRHIIWRSKYLGMGPEKVGREEKEILYRYQNQLETYRTEKYEENMYIGDIKNLIDYSTDETEITENVEYVASKDTKKRKNQILSFSDEE